MPGALLLLRAPPGRLKKPSMDEKSIKMNGFHRLAPKAAMPKIGYWAGIVENDNDPQTDCRAGIRLPSPRLILALPDQSSQFSGQSVVTGAAWTMYPCI